MRRISTQLPKLRAKKLMLSGLILGLFSFSSQAQTTYSNNDSISISVATLGPTPGSVYPSTIPVSGLAGTINGITVTLTGLKHNFPSGLDILLVAPDNKNVTLMSDVGGADDVPVPINIILKDDAGGFLPNSQLTSGEYKPTDLSIGDNDTWPAPQAPEPPVPDPSGNTALSTFHGISPNGNWRLFVVNDDDGSIGYIKGWSLTINTIAVLPVTLESFTPSYLAAQRSVLLKWTTANETNSHSFVVEASGNGTDWKALGSVRSAGTTIYQQSYQYMDNDPLQGKNYYRLKQVDLDNKTRYSNVVAVNAELLQGLKNPLFLNPATPFSGVYINTIPQEKFSLLVVDISGRVLIKKQNIVSNSSSYYLDLNNLNNGMYFLNVLSGRQVTSQMLLLTK